MKFFIHNMNHGSAHLPYSFIYQALWFLFSQMLKRRGEKK